MYIIICTTNVHKYRSPFAFDAMAAVMQENYSKYNELGLRMVNKVTF